MIQDSIQVLRAQGHKVTKPRLQVIEILSKAQKPASAYEIQDLLRQQGKYLNHVTIYRVLELLCHLKLAHNLPSGKSFTKCTLGNREGCHRFMICHNCGTIKEYVDDKICRSEKKVARDIGFYTQYHISESYGLCSDCHKGELAENV
jgi:Fe2+ or Zn2+ uptake regulation protein